MGEPFSLTLRGACDALADWIARNWERLSPDDRVELITIGVVLLRLGIAHDVNPAQFKLPSEGKDKGENLAIAPKRTWSAIAAISGAK